MNFKTLFIINRIVTPSVVVLFGASMLLLSGSVQAAAQITIGIPFAALCLYGARLGWRLQREQFIPMGCPLCGRKGDAGRGMTREVGWWFRCDNCGILKPRGLFGLRYNRQVVKDE